MAKREGGKGKEGRELENKGLPLLMWMGEWVRGGARQACLGGRRCEPMWDACLLIIFSQSMLFIIGRAAQHARPLRTQNGKKRQTAERERVVSLFFFFFCFFLGGGGGGGV